jgi:hypothetical protein
LKAGEKNNLVISKGKFVTLQKQAKTFVINLSPTTVNKSITLDSKREVLVLRNEACKISQHLK